LKIKDEKLKKSLYSSFDRTFFAFFLVQELKNQLVVVDRSVAAVEFDLYGHILAANQNFLKIVGN
jgi:hypothetical protein